MTQEKPDLSKLNVRRTRDTSREEKQTEKPPAVTAGPIEKVVDYLFNPSDDKQREVTSIDRIQGRLLPQLDVVDMMWGYAIEISVYRWDAIEYEKLYDKESPIPPNPVREFIRRTAQWQKSIQAMGLKSGLGIAQAEAESRMSEGEEPLIGHEFEDR